MKLVQHPNVVRLYEVIDTHTKLYLILELGDGGDMFDHIMRHEGGLAEARAKHYFAQIVHAISYCHKLHVVHRDLKPENVVFFQEQGVVKLTDFGFSNRFQPGKMLTTSCGSRASSAPEMGGVRCPSCRHLEPGGHPLHAGLWPPPFPGGQRQRDPHHDHGLPIHRPHTRLGSIRCLLPLTSHKRVSQEEHEIILRAMMCGNIADRDTIQEALEADRYNHITATYFLLAERMLREKQSRSLSLVYNLAKDVQS
ncbi:PREDICTED: SNF-related serine/threonine-protein kinase-like, partial [Nestor notabilis]|uniref:SNF-related serine/threonine-protein kinase-like n=1 Tax=Nestor notabilis TaxID=176057 RepID=UPI0005237DD5